MFKDKQHGFGKQILNIAICEVHEENETAYAFFFGSSNYELTILEDFNEETAKDYF
jgi:hypothetical protein